MQNLKMSTGTEFTGTQNPIPVLKVIKSVKEDEYQYLMCEYRYSKLLKA